MTYTSTAFANPLAFTPEPLPQTASNDLQATPQTFDVVALTIATTSTPSSPEAMPIAEASEPPSLAIFGAGVIFAAGIFRRRVRT